MDADPYQSEFVVPGDPVPQSRPRVTRSGHVYYASRIVQYRRAVEAAARASGLPLREGPVWLGIEAVFQRPKSHIKNRGGVGVVRPDAPAFPYSRGDATNLAKGIEDALNQIAWADDSQVVELTVRRRWAKPGEDAGAYIAICDIEPTPDVIEKRRNTISRQWTVAEREARNVNRRPSVQERRMINYRDIFDAEADYG